MIAMRKWILLMLVAAVGCSNGGEETDPGEVTPVDGAPIAEPASARPVRPANEIDVRFVSRRTHTAILFHTARMRKSSVYKNRLISSIDGYSHWVEELPTKYVMLLSDASEAPGDGFVADSHWVVKFEGAFDMKQWLDSRFDEVKEARALQKTFFTMKWEEKTMAAYAPDSDTMIFGPSAKIRQLITMLATPTGFAERLQHIDVDHDVCMLFKSAKQANDFPKMAMTWVSQEQQAFLQPIVKNAQWIEAGIDLGGDPIASLEIEYADAATATAQTAEINLAIDAARKHYLRQRTAVAEALLLTSSENVMQAIDRAIQGIKVKPKSEMIFLSSSAPSTSLAQMLLIAGNQLPDKEGSDGSESSDSEEPN